VRGYARRSREAEPYSFSTDNDTTPNTCTFDRAAFNLAGAPEADQVSFSYVGLTFTAVPEPSTYGLIGAGALAAVAVVRRRRKPAGKARKRKTSYP
jgi:hypothetical protein